MNIKSSFCRVCFFFLILFCLNSFQALNAQNSRMGSKKSKSKVVRKMKSRVSKNATIKNAVPVARKFFEGELLYVSYECQSKALIRYSSGMAYNGERTKLVTIKGNSLDIYDRSLQYHTTILGDDKVVVLWSDVTKMALHFDWSFLSMYLNVLGPEPNPITPNATKHSTMRDVGTINYKGDGLQIFKGQQTLVGGVYDVEFWYSKKYLVPDCYRYVNWGAQIDGIVKKWVYTFDGSKTILGSFYGTAAMELVSLYEHSVDPKALEVPSDYKHVYDAKNKDLLKFYKNLSKKLIKNKEYPSDNYELAKLCINDSWPFTTTWIANAKKKGTSFWENVQLGMNLFSSALSVFSKNSTAMSQTSVAEDMNVPSGRDESYYQSQYDIWKNKAINCQRDAIKHKTKGKLSGDGGYSRMGRSDLQQLRTIQKHMRWIRNTAAKEGFYILQSEYETSIP